MHYYFIFAAFFFYIQTSSALQIAQRKSNPQKQHNKVIDFSLNGDLLQAVEQDDLKTIQKLFEGEIIPQVNAKSFYGDTPLIIAASNGDAYALLLLIEADADLDVQNKEGDTALIKAAQEGYSYVTLLLLQAGADYEKQNKYGMNALMFATNYGKTKIVDQLMGKNACLKTEDIMGNTVLLSALLGSHIKLVEKFIQAGVPVEGRNKRGQSPLFWAIAQRNTELTQKLIATPGSDINAKTCGQTPLFWAIQYNFPEAVEQLIVAGADVTYCDSNGNSALDFAWKSCESLPGKIIVLLTQAGATCNLRTVVQQQMPRFPGRNRYVLQAIEDDCARDRAAYPQRKQKAIAMINQMTTAVSTEQWVQPITFIIAEYAYGPSVLDLPNSKN